ncbi:MAG: endolytic transglycosylase MltG [Patescibacteria group bacterium]
MLSKYRKILMIVLAGVAALAVVWYVLLTALMARPVSGEIKTEVLDIKPGSSSWQTAKELKRKRLIRSSAQFWFNLKLTGRAVQAGIYYLSPSQSGREIMRVIAKGEVSEYRITIPEGWRIEQIGQLLESRNIVTAAPFNQAAQGKEGKLFPDTYRLSLGISAAEIVEKMTANFAKRIEGLKLTNEHLIIASIVEREAKHDEDRPKMAGVYSNRLKIGMALEADPTVQYALDTQRLKDSTPQGLKTFKFWQPPTADQNKNFESLYNTYRHKGLPPGPICNPGLKSIQAALNPEKHDYYFFFNLQDGSTIYSKTRDEHDANRKKYGV